MEGAREPHEVFIGSLLAAFPGYGTFDILEAEILPPIGEDQSAARRDR
jgi:hypothetical protein